jgi:hypothetical protein
MQFLKILSEIKFSAKLLKSLFEVINVEGDGYCLFRCIYMALNRLEKDIDLKNKKTAKEFGKFLKNLSDITGENQIKFQQISKIFEKQMISGKYYLKKDLWGESACLLTNVQKDIKKTIIILNPDNENYLNINYVVKPDNESEFGVTQISLTDNLLDCVFIFYESGHWL